MDDEKELASRRADQVMFGFEFQVNAAIILMLRNIKSLDTIRIEGNYEDIELQLTDGEKILAQAKGVQLGSSNFHNVRANLKKALKTLSEGGNKATNVKQLIFITNSFNPFNDEASKGIFSGPPSYRTYDSLPDSSKKIIDDYLRFLYNGIIIKHQKTEPTYTKTSLFLCEKRRFFMARREKGVVPIIYFEKERGKSF